MAQHITLETLQSSHFRSPKGELIVNAIVKASQFVDRRELRFGFAPNLRVAKKKSAVIGSILDRIESEKTFHIASPLLISCRKSEILNGRIELEVNPEIDGIMDGGHRCRAFEMAAIKGLPLDGVTVQVQIFPGLGQQALRNKAIQANTNRSVSARSRQYFSGMFDELIEKIDMTKYPACFWRDGESPDATGIFCQGTHILLLLAWVSPDIHDRSGHGASPHSRAKTLGLGNEKNTLSIPTVIKVAHLFDDVFAIEKAVINALLRNQKFVSFVRMTPSTGRISFQYSSKLLDGSEIHARMPGAIAGPVIYPVRKMLGRNYQWQHPASQWMAKWVRHAVPQYIKKLQQLGAEEFSLSDLLSSSPNVWRHMDTLFDKWRNGQGIPDLY